MGLQWRINKGYTFETILPSLENGVVLKQRMVLVSEWLQLDLVVRKDHPLKLHVQEMYTLANEHLLRLS